MTRSFRTHLASRFTLIMTLATLVVAAAGHAALTTVLDREIEASLMAIASIQAAALTDDPTGDMHLHEWEITAEEATTLRDLTRYVQVWSETGESLIRSRYLTRDLPFDPASLTRAIQGEIAWHEDTSGENRLRSLYYPLGRMGPSHSPHVLQVAAPLAGRDRTLTLVRYFLLGALVLVAGGTLFGSWWLGSRAIRPVHEIIDQTEEIGANTLGRRISAHADTLEYERLVRVLNTMLARVDRAFEAQRRFTADASHELRSPVTALRGELELALRRERSPAEYRRVIASALEETQRLADMAANLLTLARSDAGVLAPRLVRVDLRERAAETIARMRGSAETKDIDIELAARSPATAICDPDLIDRLLQNLLDNAIKFTTPGGHVKIDVSTLDGGAVLEVCDTGPGVTEEARERIFRRFHREDASHGSVEGTGLGLSIVKAIAEAHGGAVTVINREAGGARFRVSWPVASSPDAVNGESRTAGGR